MKKIHLCLVTVVALFAVIAGFIKANNYYAKAEEVAEVAMRLENKIVGDTIQQISERMWSLEKKNEYKDFSEWNEEDLIEYKKLQLQLEELEKKQEVLLKQQAEKT